MSQNVITRRLRPYLFTSLRRAYSRSTRLQSSSSSQPVQSGIPALKEATNDYERRVLQLEAVKPSKEWYPRLKACPHAQKTIDNFHVDYEDIKPGKTIHSDIEAFRGRVRSIRTAGSKLVFLDLEKGNNALQIVCQLDKIKEGDLWSNETVAEQFRYFTKLARKGDWYSVEGLPHRTPRGELSILATSVPTLLSPSLHQIPEELEDAETRSRNRHVDMLVNPEVIQTLRVRATVEKEIASFLDDQSFTAVHTPILTSGASGAIARPFETEATELEGQKLNLRIAPELWLKRLVVGGMEKVYEIGPAFRNEGVDATHNPEFYICEFYEAFATLEDLMDKTEDMLYAIQHAVKQMKGLSNLSTPTPLSGPFEKLEFIPTLESEIGESLPNLLDPEAQGQIQLLFKKHSIQLPANPTLPRLLDTLSAHFLERLCQDPTFITHHPACLSPLSKHFTCPRTGQIISARAELFIQGREIANMYEEENSPFEQRRKFFEQAQYRDEEGMEVDESYLEALEWGLPPTGGWGCGVDRLAMLFSGREGIGDVLAFGSLRNVVGLGRGRKGRG